MTTLLTLWLVATVPLALLLGVIVGVQAIWPVRHHATSRPRLVPQQSPQDEESRAAA